MGGKSGGGYSTAGMESAARESNALQKQIYDESVQRGQPYYNVGTSALGNLAGLMGISQAQNPSNRQQLIDQYSPQFTSQNAQTGQVGTYRDAKGRVGDFGQLAQLAYDDGGQRKAYNFTGNKAWSMARDGRAPTAQDLQQFGFSPLTTGGGSTTDTAGLNSYVDNLISQQSAQEQSPTFGSLMQNFGLDKFQADPSYAFRQGEGNKALQRQLAAAGKTYSPEAVKALQTYNQDLASQEYGNAYNRYNNDQTNIFNRLSSLAGVGQQQNQQLDALGQNMATNINNTNTSLSNAQAAAAQAKAQNKSSMFGQLLGTGLQAAMAFSDKNLKTNIVPIGQENGHNVYLFRYKNDPSKLYRGVMAQDVVEKVPDAVSVIDGVMRVNYDMIGVVFAEVA